MAKVSICIANYNYGQFIGETIESCLAQTHNDLEIVVADDGSTDNSKAVLGSYGEKIVALYGENCGQTLSLRRAVAASSGALVITLDADDLLDPDTAARVVAAYEADPSVARIQWRLRVVGAQGESTGITFPPAHWVMPEGDLCHRVLTRRTYLWPPTSGNAFPRSVIELIFSATCDRRQLDPELRQAVDLLLADSSALIGPIVNLSDTGGSYRRHGNNDSALTTRYPVRYLHHKVNEIVASHAAACAVADELGIDCPSDPRVALDWAFAGYRLASLRLEPRTHPFPEDRVIALAARGIRAVLTQPDYAVMARLKRGLWFAATGLAPNATARKLIERMYLRPD
jgi:hypothetical protein